MAKIGGECCDNDAFARVYNNLLLHEYIYYFTPVHFQLVVCPFLYTVSPKNIPDVFSYNSRKHCPIFIIFGRNITE